ncbi:MAG: DEAD/DEAH box helicase [Thermomicrobiales bacterium]
MATRTGAAAPRPEFDTQIEEEAAALLAEAGLVVDSAPAQKKPRTRKAATDDTTKAESPAPRKSRTKALPLENLVTEEVSEAAPVRKPRKKAVEPVVETISESSTEKPARKPRKPRETVEVKLAEGQESLAPTTTEEVAPEEAVATQPAGPTFADLGLSEALLKSLRDVGYEAPSPIQEITIPAMLRGVDVIAQAQTGSGKTAAFGLPIIEELDGRDRNVQALILTPTRELAIQVAEALHKYGKHKHIETLPIYGGQPYERQFRGLQRGAQIVVGTPGRVMDHMRRGTLNLDHIRYFVLDEADEMLDMGFIEDIEWVLEHAPKDRQTALFSATMPPRIVDLSRQYLNEPERLVVPGKQMTVPATRQTYYEVPRSRKIDALTRILDAETPPLTMIFCRTKHGVDELGEALLARGFGAETLHGDLSQAQRDRVMKRFRSGQADILVATDVRGARSDIGKRFARHHLRYSGKLSLVKPFMHRPYWTAGGAPAKRDADHPQGSALAASIERIIKARTRASPVLPTAADVADRRRRRSGCRSWKCWKPRTVTRRTWTPSAIWPRNTIWLKWPPRCWGYTQMKPQGDFHRPQGMTIWPYWTQQRGSCGSRVWSASS